MRRATTSEGTKNTSGCRPLVGQPSVKTKAYQSASWDILAAFKLVGHIQ
jgi:hypothetical protein